MTIKYFFFFFFPFIYSDCPYHAQTESDPITKGSMTPTTIITTTDFSSMTITQPIERHVNEIVKVSNRYDLIFWFSTFLFFFYFSRFWFRFNLKYHLSFFFYLYFFWFRFLVGFFPFLSLIFSFLFFIFWFLHL